MKPDPDFRSGPPHGTPGPYSIVLDQGTSATKVFVFGPDHQVHFSERITHVVRNPAPNHFESDPLDILEACYSLVRTAGEFCLSRSRSIQGLGLAFQRSTFLFWDRTSIRPLTPAVSWQDTRAETSARRLAEFAPLIQARTGTPLSAHFGGPKYLHLLEQYPDLASRVNSGRVFFGPLSAFITQSLTGVAGVEPSIAGRSLLMNLDTAAWDAELCRLFRIPEDILPPLKPSRADHGTLVMDGIRIPVRCVLGDQQAALVGQGEDRTGSMVLNFGTSGSVLLTTGDTPAHIPGLISSVLYSTPARRRYLLEGTINGCKSLFDWLEQEQGLPVRKLNWDRVCRRTGTSGVLIPGFNGLAAPYWKDRFTTVLVGLSFEGDPEPVIRAAMESIGFLLYDIVTLIRRYRPGEPRRVAAGGGLALPALVQFVADLLEMPVTRAQMRDRTALGVYRMLGLESGSPAPDQPAGEMFFPAMASARRAGRLAAWHQALVKAGIPALTR